MYAPQSFYAALKLLGIEDPTPEGARVDRIELARDHWVIWYSHRETDGSIKRKATNKGSQPLQYQERRRYSG